ncbi:hypothetical protein KORDIASMS9_01118 [Kordia sp. SMS9]|uniref:hypothetical protein n=1 Tax=Kordia sp. SMS9 TaxID=2282170 RepID=UPI000E0D5FD2|nr:hypothetical protein [Kordia sp. SMS9]AXG68900.1 hypothetical protein KORDIASMS9_01118 [Kordia sp. SMS9]
MKKKNLKSLKLNKQKVSELNHDEVTGGTGSFYSFIPGLYCGAGPTTSFGPLACEVACLCLDEEY